MHVKVEIDECPKPYSDVSINIDSLYINIDTTLGLQAIREIFGNFSDHNRLDEGSVGAIKTLPDKE